MMRWCVIEKTWHWQQHRQRRRREMCAQIAVLTNWVISQHVLFWHYPTPSQTDCWTQRDQNDSLLTILSNVGDGSTKETTHSNPTTATNMLSNWKVPIFVLVQRRVSSSVLPSETRQEKIFRRWKSHFLQKVIPIPLTVQFPLPSFFNSQFWSVNLGQLGRRRITFRCTWLAQVAELRVPSNITVRLCSLAKYGVPSLWHFYSAYNIIQLPLSLPSPFSLDD